MQIDPQIVSILISAGVSGLAAIFTYLVRSYFNRIAASLRALRAEVNKLDGRFEGLSAEVRLNTKEVHGLAIETRAVWRFIDNANKRSTDGGSNERSTN